MKRRLGNFATWLLLLMAVALGACQSTSSGKGVFCSPRFDLEYRQTVYDAMSDEEAAKHLAYLKARESLCK